MLETNIPLVYPVVDLFTPLKPELPGFEPYKNSFLWTMPATYTFFADRHWCVLVPTGIGVECSLLEVKPNILWNLLKAKRAHVITIADHPYYPNDSVFLYISKYHPHA